MKQHQTGNDSRNCWKRPRDRERLKARYEIRERVATGGGCLPALHNKADKDETMDVEMCKLFLRQASDGSVSSFSLSKLSKHVALLARPVPTSLLSDYKIKTLCTSRYGPDHAKMILDFVHVRQSCTIMEYAALLGEYRVVGSLLVGGIDPTIAGDFLSTKTTPVEYNVSREASIKVQHRFFDSFPVSLSTYIVKRVVEMRIKGWAEGFHGLCFGEPCMHTFVEETLWLDLLDQLDDRTTEDIVLCPICGESSPLKEDIDNLDVKDLPLSPDQRYNKSLEMYMALAADTRELRARPKKAPKKRVLSRSWHQAVCQSLGNSQDVRRDKFFHHVERGAYHYVRGCCRLGIDVNLTNEYGQTALYIATWKGNKSIVELLLHFGADWSIAAYGGSTPLAVALANNQHDIGAILSQLVDDETRHINHCMPINLGVPLTARLDVLIPTSADHPGAGSYIIDDALSEECLECIVDMKEKLPLAVSENKRQTCSDRYYYCDSHGWIRRALEASIEKMISTAQVLGHMRFLDYQHAGTILAPHVDLCRVEGSRRSTHTFILYLHSCISGGETVLLKELVSYDALAHVDPKRGRLLLFPHNCPHFGAEVVDVPKLLLRGEVILDTPSVRILRQVEG